MAYVYDVLLNRHRHRLVCIGLVAENPAGGLVLQATHRLPKWRFFDSASVSGLGFVRVDLGVTTWYERFTPSRRKAREVPRPSTILCFTVVGVLIVLSKTREYIGNERVCAQGALLACSAESADTAAL